MRSLPAALGPPLAVVAVAATGCVGILLADPTTPGGPLPVCPTRALIGLCCPGCGGLRMVYSLLHGRIGDAVHYNAVSLVFLGLFTWSLVAWTVARVRGREQWSWLQWRWTPPVAIAVLTVWFVIRNLPFAPFIELSV
ncbi:MAG: DUF2752 domain-containing protein [Actinomycetota bacterium]|nr:DUF2752 domain-containing protein [Actinomycetota bacterium]